MKFIVFWENRQLGETAMAKKILIVEDNAVNMRLVRMTLRHDGLEFIEASNGEDALSMTATHRPDIVILDIQIPKLDGFEVAKRLKSDDALKHIPLIGLTAHAMKGDEEKVIESGCDAYVSKPLDTASFRKMVYEFLGI